MLGVLLAAKDSGIDGDLILTLVVALALAVLVGWIVMYFGVPQPLAALVALVVFLLILFGSGGAG